MFVIHKYTLITSSMWNHKHANFEGTLEKTHIQSVQQIMNLIAQNTSPTITHCQK